MAIQSSVGRPCVPRCIRRALPCWRRSASAAPIRSAERLRPNKLLISVRGHAVVSDLAQRPQDLVGHGVADGVTEDVAS